jgi:hypothetical protein
MNIIRKDPCYLSHEVWRALWVIAKSRGKRTDAQGYEVLTTPDEVANDFLLELIKEKYPQILEHQRQAAKLEANLIKTLEPKE